MGRLTDYFIPDDLGDEQELERRRAEIAVKTVFILFPCGLVATVFTLWLFQSPAITLGMALLPTSLGVAPFVLRHTGSMTWTSALILVPLYGVVAWYAASTGGLFAPSVSILLLIPPLAIVFLGMRAAAIWLVVVVITWGAMFGAEMTWFDGFAYFDDERYPVRRMTELLILAATVSGLFYLKDSLQRWLVARVRKQEAETRAVLETAPDGILTVDLDGVVQSANEAVGELFGHDRDEVVDSEIKDLVTSLGTDDVAERQQFGVTEEHCGQSGDGQFPLEVAFGLIDDEQLAQPQVVLVMRDITERKEAEQKLRQARDEALEASRAKTTFLANMSHELRTPLNAVIGYSEIMLEEFEFLEEESPEDAEIIGEFLPDVARIHTAGEHLLALINDILDLSKIEAGQMQVHVESFDVRNLIEDIASTIQPLANNNDNALHLDIGDDLQMMCSDVTKVRQILFNLLSNACKFTEGGTVRLGADVDGEFITFEVEDTGIGMSAEEVEEVFEAFQQADASTTRKFGGTGLGLTITSHFCSLLDGSIDVESQPGEGTRFEVKLRRELEGGGDDGSDDGDRKAKKTAATTPAVVSDARGFDGDSAGSVLVVDDDETIRQLMRRILESEGYQVATAADGTEGLLLAREVEPDVIILDVMMPQMDGWTMLTKLDDDPKTADIPVVILSMLSEQQRGFALGVEHYLVKPVDRQQLVDILDQYGSGDGGERTILVVEDDEPTRSMIRRTLKGEGWDVTEAANGVDGLDSAQQTHPDLVILDLMMPRMDGVEFLDEFRRHPDYGDVPVVIVTAKELSQEERQRLETDVEKILSKGGRQRDELLDEIRRLVEDVAEPVEPNT